MLRATLITVTARAVRLAEGGIATGRKVRLGVARLVAEATRFIREATRFTVPKRGSAWRGPRGENGLKPLPWPKRLPWPPKGFGPPARLAPRDS